MIYFFACPEVSAVKIGYTLDAEMLARRLASTQTNCPLKIELVAAHDGGLVDERALHDRFEQDRIQGEWFRLSPALVAYIAEHPAPELPARRAYRLRNRKPKWAFSSNSSAPKSPGAAIGRRVSHRRPLIQTRTP